MANLDAKLHNLFVVDNSVCMQWAAACKVPTILSHIPVGVRQTHSLLYFTHHHAGRMPSVVVHVIANMLFQVTNRQMKNPHCKAQAE